MKTIDSDSLSSSSSSSDELGSTIAQVLVEMLADARGVVDKEESFLHSASSVPSNIIIRGNFTSKSLPDAHDHDLVESKASDEKDAAIGLLENKVRELEQKLSSLTASEENLRHDLEAKNHDIAKLQESLKSQEAKSAELQQRLELVLATSVEVPANIVKSCTSKSRSLAVIKPKKCLQQTTTKPETRLRQAKHLERQRKKRLEEKRLKQARLERQRKKRLEETRLKQARLERQRKKRLEEKRLKQARLERQRNKRLEEARMKQARFEWPRKERAGPSVTTLLLQQARLELQRKERANLLRKGRGLVEEATPKVNRRSS